MLELKILSSLEKIFPDSAGTETTRFSAMRNEPVSFQIAYKNAGGERYVQPFYTVIDTDLEISLISQYKIGYVPVAQCVNIPEDEYYDRKTPGLFPDPLLPRGTNDRVENDGFWAPRFYEQDEKNQLNSYPACCQGLWFTVNENGAQIPAGEHYVTVRFLSAADGKEIGTKTAEITVADAYLPEQTLFYTSWFHNDCLADIYGVDIFSDRYFEIMESFVAEAAKTGMNMILLPAFTPPLDTPVGKERKTAQLVRISLENGEYSFDFSLMEKYMSLCLKCGIKYFEHCQLFTQWGAKAAPKIFADTPDGCKRIFGWETDSKSEEYSAFLKAYLRSLMKFLKNAGLEKNIFFHISDEPMPDNIEYYRNAKNIIKGEIGDCPSGDPLAHYEFFEDGSVQIPIISVNSPDMDKFTASCDNFWVYYTGESLYDGYTNRIITTPGARNRIIGVQMYMAGAKGFLHWGYNYYYDVLSHGLFNPLNDPCGYGGLPGTSFIVYPSPDGKAIASARMKVFYEGLNDYRALKLLESKIGKEQTKKAVLDFFGEMNFRTCPDNSNLIEFRNLLCRLINEN